MKKEQKQKQKEELPIRIELPKIKRLRTSPAIRIRKQWIKYFSEKKHTLLPSASLLPIGDPTLLFTTAGMVPFKDYFSGRSQAPSKRVVSIQKCLRTTDLDNVGKTERHCSFFEMLGNFSFGDYFKKEAIQYAWDFSLQNLKLDPERIYVTVYKEDDEAARIWREDIGFNTKRIYRLGKEDNWWGPAGDQGPCGPCSELYWDRGEHICVNCNCKNKKRPASCVPGEENERFVEYWNLVFNEFYSDSDGKLQPLPQKGVDTGAGLERIVAILEKKESLYETVEIQILIRAIEDVTTIISSEQTKILYDAGTKVAFRVIADHIRTICFSIGDGIYPSNTGRGYVVRRIIRRALMYARELKIYQPVLYWLVDTVVQLYGNFYPELKARKVDIEKRLLTEERRFLETLEIGLKKWKELLAVHNAKNKKIFSGKDAFILYDTYGFPVELTEELIRKAKLQLDSKGFSKEMEKQHMRSTAHSQWNEQTLPIMDSQRLFPSQFVGYKQDTSHSSVIAIWQESKSIEKLRAGEQAIIVLDKTPFYSEGGGQLGDQGRLITKSGSIFIVENTQKSGSLILHIGRLEGKVGIRINDTVESNIDAERREGLRRHHSSTHLLNSALRKHLGSHILQTGSLVAPNRLRFDFSHSEKLSQGLLEKISSQVNLAISAKAPVQAKTMSIQDAHKQGAVATFGEKYGEEVRVLSMGKNGEYSREFCGGCHVNNTGDIGLFYITRESSPSAGNRRIEAISGDDVGQYFQEEWSTLQREIQKYNEELQKEMLSLAASVQEKKKFMELQIHTNLDEDTFEKLTSFKETTRLQKTLAKIRTQLGEARKKKLKFFKSIKTKEIDKLLDTHRKKIQDIFGVQVLVADLGIQKADALRQFSDQIKESHRGIVILLGSQSPKGGHLFFSADKKALERDLNMNELMAQVTNYIDGGGGGQAGSAMAGGKRTDGLGLALQSAQKILQKSLASKREK